jgi:hypothetical protein
MASEQEEDRQTRERLMLKGRLRELEQQLAQARALLEEYTKMDPGVLSETNCIYCNARQNYGPEQVDEHGYHFYHVTVTHEDTCIYQKARAFLGKEA